LVALYVGRRAIQPHCLRENAYAGNVYQTLSCYIMLSFNYHLVIVTTRYMLYVVLSNRL